VKIKQYILFFFLAILSSCTIGYSFTGTSLSPDVKSVSVDYFSNRASLINPNLSQEFTEGLKDKFTSQAGLTLKESDGDLQFEGAITNYRLSPVAVQKDAAAMMRLTITVQVKFHNEKNEKQDFTQSFSQYEDYASDKDFSSVEEALTSSIVEKLLDKIFIKAAANW
jgi:hypothetical protein